MCWLGENAEAMFALRASLLSDRWEEMLDCAQRTTSRDRRMAWHWQPGRFSPDAGPEATLNLPQALSPEPVSIVRETTVASSK